MSIRPVSGPRERGAAAVEFALVLPVLMLIIGAIVDFGFIFAQQIALNSATRDAVRGGVVRPLNAVAQTCNVIKTNARNGMQGGIGMNATSVTLTLSRTDTATDPCPSGSAYPCAASTQGANLQLLATYASNPPVPVPFMGSITLTSKGVFRCEYS